MSLLTFYINPLKICIFSKTTCSYCDKAKELLNTYNIEPQIIEINKSSQSHFIGNELKKLTNQTTVPNIFVFGLHIGGYNELKELHNNNKLKQIIKEKTEEKCMCEFCGIIFNNKKPICNCIVRPFDDWGTPL